MLCGLAGLIPAGPVSVLVDGCGEQPAALAARLAATLTASGRPCVRLTGMDADTAATRTRERSGSPTGQAGEGPAPGT